MTLKDANSLAKDLQPYVGQKMKPYGSKVMEILIVPCDLMQANLFITSIVTKNKTPKDLYPFYGKDFTVLVLFDPINRLLHKDGLRKVPYEIFLHNNNLTYTKDNKSQTI